MQPVGVQKVVSSLGAGDAFMAGLLWGIYRGDSKAECMARAAAVAAESIRWPIAGRIAPSHVQVENVKVSSRKLGRHGTW